VVLVSRGRLSHVLVLTDETLTAAAAAAARPLPAKQAVDGLVVEDALGRTNKYFSSNC